VSLVANSILGLIPLQVLLFAKLVLDLSMQILPHAPLVAMVNILSRRLKLAKTASVTSVKTKRRALRALMEIWMILLFHQFFTHLIIFAMHVSREKKVKTS